MKEIYYHLIEVSLIKNNDFMLLTSSYLLVLYKINKYFRFKRS